MSMYGPMGPQSGNSAPSWRQSQDKAAEAQEAPETPSSATESQQVEEPAEPAPEPPAESTEPQEPAADEASLDIPEDDGLPPVLQILIEDLAAHRRAYDALEIPSNGADYVHTPGAGLMPKSEVLALLKRLDYASEPLPWMDHVVDFRVTETELSLTLADDAPTTALRALMDVGIFALADGPQRAYAPSESFAEGIAQREIASAIPQLMDLCEGTMEHWGRTWQRLGIYESNRRQDGSETVFVPEPLGFRLLPDGRSVLALRTPVSKPLKSWEQKLDAVRAKLKRKVELVELAPNVVGITPPSKAQAMQPWVPNADEQLWVMADSPEAFIAGAVAAYPQLSWVQGKNREGQVLQQSMARVPHALVGGGTGSGKSTWAAWLLTACSLAGADLIIADGKGSSDYVGIAKSLPNVLLYSATDAEHIRSLQWIYAEMNHRYKEQKLAATRGEKYEPRSIVFLFDEYGAFVEGITTKGHPQNSGWGDVQAQLTQVLQKARAVKIHLLFVAQTLYAETFPGKMKGNIQARLSLGVPEPYTLQTVAGDAYQQAKEISRQIPRGKPGQGVAVTSSADGEAEAQRVSVAYGFVPGRKAPSKAIKTAWETLQPIYESIPRVTPRIAPIFDAPVQPAGRKEGEGLPADWHSYTCDELAQLPWVRVSSSDLIGAPLSEAARYDSLSAKYAGDDIDDNTGFNTYH